MPLTEGMNVSRTSGLRRLRENKGLTRKEVGERMGISSVQVANYESDKSWPRLMTAHRLAVALDITLDELFTVMSAGRETEDQREAPPAE